MRYKIVQRMVARTSELLCINESIMCIVLPEGKTIGTCFLAPIYSPSNPYHQFIITAFHTIAESFVYGRPVLVKDSNGRILSTIIEYPVSPSERPQGVGHDFSILRVNGGIPSEPIPCSNDTAPGSIFIRGLSQGLETRFSNVEGVLNGLEEGKIGPYKILDLTIPDFYRSYVPSNSGDESGDLFPHDVWQGISGAPIILRSSEGKKLLYAMGVIVRLSRGAMAGRAYGVPISVIASVCKSLGLLMELLQPHVSDKESVVEHQFIGNLFQGLEDPNTEMYLWDHISNLLYRGIPSDELLLNLLNNPGEYNLGPCDLPFVEYFRARLMLKRGRLNHGLKKLDDASRKSEAASESVKRRIKALVESRLIVEDVSSNLVQRINRLSEIHGKLESLRDVSEKYIVAEIASLLGRGVISVFLNAHELDKKSMPELHRLILEHGTLLKYNPIELKKQDVVNTFMKCLSLLWGIQDSDNLVYDLTELSDIGFRQTKQRKNSIFYIQMLLNKAIAYWLGGKRYRALCMLFTAGKLLYLGNLTLNHEGISELFFYLKRELPECANALQKAYDLAAFGISDRLNMLGSLVIPHKEIIQVERKSSEWLEEFRDWNSIYEVSPAIFED